MSMKIGRIDHSKQSAVHAAIAKKYAEPAWATFFEVGDATGAEKRRSADAVAMSCWPSLGLQLYAFEIKVSRSDWLREMKDPSKAEAICQYVDRFWLVVGDEGIVRDGELPPTWGLQVLTSRGLRVAVDAPTFARPPWPRAWIASLLRASKKGTVPATEVDRRVAEIVERERAMQRFDPERRAAEAAASELETLRKHVADFERASGIKVLGGYDPQTQLVSSARQQGLALRLLLLAERDAVLERLREQASATGRAVDELIAECRRTTAELDPEETSPPEPVDDP